MNFDELNTNYFKALFKKFEKLNSGSNSKELPLYIHEDNVTPSGDVTEVFPTAIATNDQMKHLNVVHYSDLMKNQNVKFACDAALWVKKMQAGTGSSMTRSSYLAQLKNIPESEVKIGAKGTDLFIDCQDHKISIAEAQILQAFSDARAKKFGKVILHDIVSSETENSIEEIWNKKSILDPSKSYRELVENDEGVSYFGKSFQEHIPTIDEAGEISFNRKAPGGHALFGVDALMAAYKKSMRPNTNGLTLISSVGNGEDLSSAPDEYMVAWMVEHQIPIAMVTTTKTNNDMKGGQVSVVMPENGVPYMCMLEKAQAETANQLPLFEELGLRDGDHEAFFNTNMIVLNYDVLAPKIEALVEKIGEEEFLSVISPDLILNKKKQVDEDGVTRTYIQLEGAMGSVILNLDRYFRNEFGEGLVSIINVDAQNRTKFFCPIKSAFDYFMQFHSDRFTFNTKTYRLENNRPGCLPMTNFKGDIYKDVLPVLTRFKNCRILDLDKLEVSGDVNFANSTLIGKVTVINENDALDIMPFTEDGVLKDAEVKA